MKTGSKVLRIAFFERVSTEEQKIHGYSIPAQDEALHEWIANKDYKLVEVVRDEGVSARKPVMKRPGVLRLLELVEADAIDMIVFTKLDRWFRSVGEYHETQKVLDRHGVTWRTILEDYNTDTADGRLKVNIMLSVAENEADRTSERINFVLDNRRKSKIACFGGKYVPIGYKKERDAEGIMRLVIDPETEPAVREFWRIVTTEKSIMTAAKTVNAEYGLSRAYKEWTRTFNSSLYTGTYKGVEDFCPAYISKEDWELAKAARTVKRSPAGRIYLFTGMLACPSCGTILSSNYKKYKEYDDREYYSYRCRHFSVRRCDYNGSVPELKAEKWLLKNVRKKLEQYLVQSEVAASAPKPKPKKDKAKINEKIRRLNVIYVAGGKSDKEYLAELADLQAELNAAEAQEVQSPVDLSSLRALLDSDFEAVYNALERPEKRQFWRGIIDKLIVEGNRIVDVRFR